MVGGGNRDSQLIDRGNYEETNNRASWNEFKKAQLVKLLVEFHQPGARKQIGWSNDAWNEITTRFNAQFSDNFSLKQIKEQERTLKKQYETIHRLRIRPGFRWDITTNMVIAPEEVRASLVKDKEIKRWYNKPFPYYDDLHKLYGGFIATGKRKRRSTYFTNNEVEFEPTIPTIHAPREQPHFDVEDDFLSTQVENSSISTQPNLNFAQEPSPIQPSIFTASIIAPMREQTQHICASIEKKSDRTATHNEKFSVSAAVKTFEQLQGFSKGDFLIASTIFIDNPRVCEVFLSCNEENRATWIKAMIDQHKAKQLVVMENGRKRPLEELEQDADQNHPRLRQVRVISSTENGRKSPQEGLEQDINENQPQSKLVRVGSSMENGRKRQWEQREQDANQNHPQFSQLQVILSHLNVEKRQWEELEQDANQNHPLLSQVRVILSVLNGPKRQWEERGQDAYQNNRQPIQARVILSVKKNWERLLEELGFIANQNEPLEKLLGEISSMINGRKPPRAELEQDANQNQPRSSRMRTTLSSYLRERFLGTIVNGIFLFVEQTLIDRVNDELFQPMMRNPQYNIEEAVPTQRTSHIEDLPRYKLVFANEVGQTMYTGQNITDENEMPIEIQLLDIKDGQCTNMEGLNIKLKIVVIDGDLGQEGLDCVKFSNNIVKEKDGKRPLLVGNTEVTINHQGVGTMGAAHFTDNSSGVRSRKFRLGVCIDSERCGTNIKIQVGLSNNFVVLDCRGLYSKKPPNLNDNVWRLVGIKKDGIYHQRLMDNNINNVKDFLKLLKENPSVLKEEILKMLTYVWNKVVKHARTCNMELDNANLENNANLPKSPGPEPSLPNPMPEVQRENMGMAAESNLVADQMERFPSYASFNGNNEPNSSNLHADETLREPREDENIMTAGLNTQESTSQWLDGLIWDFGSTSNSGMAGSTYCTSNSGIAGSTYFLINDDHAQ